jgi:hypothetical protein
MSIRRKAGDVVLVNQGQGFVDAGRALKAEIQGDGSDYCMLRCDDPDCQEWATLWTVEEPRFSLYHVSECAMGDANPSAPG